MRETVAMAESPLLLLVHTQIIYIEVCYRFLFHFMFCLLLSVSHTHTRVLPSAYYRTHNKTMKFILSIKEYQFGFAINTSQIFRPAKYKCKLRPAIQIAKSLTCLLWCERFHKLLREASLLKGMTKKKIGITFMFYN